jgi:two-component system, cell cycle response regulator
VWPATRKGTTAAVAEEVSLNAVRILLAHPDGSVRRVMRAVLEPLGFVVAEAATPRDTLAAARATPPEVLLLHRDLDEPVLAEVKRDPDLFGTAVILLGIPATVDAVVEAIEHGAHDVLRDEAAPAELVARVHAARRAKQMHAQLLSREHDLETLAYHDELTGLPNRRFALRQLHALISRARRHAQEVSALIVDADHFKRLNDRYGHQAGDDVLRALAARLRERLREEDIVARFGGEEFLVILPDTDAAGAAAVAEDLRGHVAATGFPVGRIAVPMTVSIGWATWHGETLERLVARADRGLYDAKEAGRDCVREAPAASNAGRR